MKILYFILFTFGIISSLNCMQDLNYGENPHKTQRVSFDVLLKLDPEKYYTNHVVQNNQDPIFIENTKSIFAQARDFCSDKSNQKNFTNGIQLYKELALKGHLESMLAIGNICQDRNNFSQALRWRVFAFQAAWLFNGEHNMDAIRGLEALMKNPKSKKHPEVKNYIKEHNLFLEYHCLHKNSSRETLLNLKSLYSNNLLETYLNRHEQQYKASWFCDYYHEHYATSNELLNAGIELFKKENFDQGVYWLKKSNTPQALYLAGGCYFEGKVGSRDGQPDYTEAARLYRLSNIPEALYMLGFMYGIGQIGSKDGKPDYEEAAKWYEQSGTPEGLCNLGNLYNWGHIDLNDGQPNYLKAKTLYLQSKHPNALWNLGKLYRDGHLGSPNYEEAAKFFTEANNSEALCDLGCLYFRGRVGLLMDGNRDLKMAEKLFVASKYYVSFVNLGGMYHFGEMDIKDRKPDYKKAFIYYGLCESHISKASPEAIDNDMLYVKLPIDILHRKLMIIKNNYSEVAQFFPSLTQEKVSLNQEQAIEQLCIKTPVKLSSLEASDREFYHGLISYYKDKNNNQALIHFNNALQQGNDQAMDYIKIIQALRKLEEEQTKPSLKLEEKKDYSAEEVSTPDAKDNNNQHEVHLIADEKEENANEERDTSTQSASDKPPSVRLPIDNSEKKEANKQENLEKERPKQYKPKPALTYAEKKKKIIEKIDNINKKIISTFEPITIRKGEPRIVASPLKVRFLNDHVEGEYKILPKKITELMDCIEEKPYGTEGVGKPEVLKGKFKGYKGCISRRIDEENRLVYKVTGAREILILACSGHY